MTTDTTRRGFVLLAGTAAALGVAGCTAAGGEDQVATSTTAESHDDEGSHDEGDHEDDEHEEGGHDEEAHDEGHEHHEELPTEPATSATVDMVTRDGAYHFEPHVVWVEPGTTVTFVNESGMHTATAYHPDNDDPLRIPEGAAPFDSGTLTEQGAEFEHTFETEGVYDYYCLPHEAMGMAGSVIVGEPDPHDQPGLADPQDSLPGEMPAKVQALNEMCNEVLGHTH